MQIKFLRFWLHVYVFTLSIIFSSSLAFALECNSYPNYSCQYHMAWRQPIVTGPNNPWFGSFIRVMAIYYVPNECDGHATKNINDEYTGFATLQTSDRYMACMQRPDSFIGGGSQP